MGQSLRVPLLFAALVRSRVFLRRSAGAAHHRAAFLDDITGIGSPVLVRLKPAPRIVLTAEGLRIGFLLRRAAAIAAEDAV